MSNDTALRSARQVTEREIAIALVMEFCRKEARWVSFSMYGFYDDDADFVANVADEVGSQANKSFVNKMKKVVRRLESYGVLVGQMRSTHKEYCGGPTHQKNYWMEPGKVRLIQQPHRPGVNFGPLGECEWLLRRAYPKPDEISHDN